MRKVFENIQPHPARLGIEIPFESSSWRQTRVAHVDGRARIHRVIRRSLQQFDNRSFARGSLFGPPCIEMAMYTLPSTGYLRLAQIIGNPKASPPVPPLIPVGKSTWWAGVRSGRFPQPTSALGGRITCWHVEDIRALIERVPSDRVTP
jgi:predicted DNA-binding transcriptional regulator AlpA